jgi:hypothetical protein
MDEIDGIYNWSGLKYGIYKMFDTFWLIIIDGHNPFGHFKHKLWPKKWMGIKLKIWLLTTKN